MVGTKKGYTSDSCRASATIPASQLKVEVFVPSWQNLVSELRLEEDGPSSYWGASAAGGPARGPMVGTEKGYTSDSCRASANIPASQLKLEVFVPSGQNLVSELRLKKDWGFGCWGKGCTKSCICSKRGGQIRTSVEVK